MKNPFYLLATFNRSFDEYHVSNKRIHLVSSVFQTDYFDISTYFKNIGKNPNISTKIIIRVVSLNSNLEKTGPALNIIEHKEYKTIEVQVTFTHLISMVKNDYSTKTFDSVILELVGDTSLTMKNKETNHILNNTLFVFENSDWFTVQLLFKMVNISISGGSITKRHLISTSNYNLIWFLMFFKYNLFNIYTSFSKKYDKNLDLSSIEEQLYLPAGLIRLYIELKLSESKESLLTQIDSLDKQITLKLSNISSLEGDKLIKRTKNSKSNIEKGVSAKKILNLNKNIDRLNKTITDYKNKILVLKSEISKIVVKENNLCNLSEDLLKVMYYKDYHNDKVVNDSLKLNNVLKDRNKGFNKYSRSYSTSCISKVV